jgi:hypothetical protein
MPKSPDNATPPDWNTNLIVGSTPSLSNYCDKCHEAPPLGLSPHDAGHTINDCDTCHQHFNNDGTLTAGANRALHINGTVEAVADCDGCHEYPPYPGDGKSYQAVEGKGAHLTHVEHLSQRIYGQSWSLQKDAANDVFGTGTPGAICGVCHTKNSSNHQTGDRLINFGDGSTAYRFTNSGSATYNGTVGSAGASDPKTCSNLSCHFTETPQWEPY